jgi:hypothetical protein
MADRNKLKESTSGTSGQTALAGSVDMSRAPVKVNKRYHLTNSSLKAFPLELGGEFPPREAFDCTTNSELYVAFSHPPIPGYGIAGKDEIHSIQYYGVFGEVDCGDPDERGKKWNVYVRIYPEGKGGKYAEMKEENEYAELPTGSVSSESFDKFGRMCLGFYDVNFPRSFL